MEIVIRFTEMFKNNIIFINSFEFIQIQFPFKNRIH